MKKKILTIKRSFSFTLVELIITIAIIAILAVMAFLMVNKWIGQSRDSKRLSDIQIIKTSLEESLLKDGSQSYPYPDDYTGIHDVSGSLMWYQGKFGNGLFANLSNLSKVPSDPGDGTYYEYSVDNTFRKYQIKSVLENGNIISYNINDFLQKVSANEESVRLFGNYEGLLVSNSGDNYRLRDVPGLFMWSGDVLLSGENMILEDGSTIENVVLISPVDISNLADSIPNNDGVVISKIMQNLGLSGDNGIIYIKNKLKHYPDISINENTDMCEANCSGKTCGDDGCGGTCGTCGVGSSCISDSCVLTDRTCSCRYYTTNVLASVIFTGGELKTRIKSEDSLYPERGCDSGRTVGTVTKCEYTGISPYGVGVAMVSYRARTSGVGQPLNGLFHQKRGGNRYDTCRCTDEDWSCWIPGTYCPEAPGGGEACRPNTCSYPPRP